MVSISLFSSFYNCNQHILSIALGNFMQLNVTNCVVKKYTDVKEVKHLTAVQLIGKYVVDFINSLDQFQLVSL